MRPTKMCIQPWWPMWPWPTWPTCGAARICCLSGLRRQGEGLWETAGTWIFHRNNIFNSSCKVKYCHIQVYEPLLIIYDFQFNPAGDSCVLLPPSCERRVPGHVEVWCPIQGAASTSYTTEVWDVTESWICCRSCICAKRVGCVTLWLTPKSLMDWIRSWSLQEGLPLHGCEGGAHPGWQSVDCDKDSGREAEGWRITHWEARVFWMQGGRDQCLICF